MAVTAELVTTITIVLICLVVAVYLVILKKNGWIGKKTNYRCPNPTCKNIFQKPMEVTDLADKNRTHFACPKCGYDLDISFFTKKITFKKQPNLKKEQPPIQSNKQEINETDNTKGTPETKPTFVNSAESSSEINPLVAISTKNAPETKPDIVNNIENNSETKSSDGNSIRTTSKSKPLLFNKTETFPETEPSVVSNIQSTPETKPIIVESEEIKQKIETRRNSVIKKPSSGINEKPPGCKFYLGYLFTLQNGTPIPHQCYTCVRQIDCYKPLEERNNGPGGI